MNIEKHIFHNLGSCRTRHKITKENEKTLKQAVNRL